VPTNIGYAVEEITPTHAKAVTDARSLLQAGMEHRAARREGTWKLVSKQYEGKQWDLDAVEDPSADLTVVNVSFATVQTIKPYITGNEPRFYLEPFSTDATRTSAALQEVFLNRLWRHPPVGAQTALRQAVFDYLKMGDGFAKTTYTIDPIKVALDEEEDVASIHVDRISPWDIWIDEYATGIHDARWIAHRIWKTQREVKDDGRYTIPPGFIFADRQTASADDEGRADRTNITQADDDQWVELIEFYDVTDRIMYAFPRNSAESDMPWQVLETVELPIVQLPNYELDNSPWHMGDLEQISKLQSELNKTRSELMTHRRRNVAKLAMKKGAVGDSAKAALKSPIVNEIVEIDTQEQLSSVFMPINMPPITADNYGASAEIKDDIREITGITEYQRGIAPEITRTATEASIMDASANVKLTAKLTIVEEAARQLGTLILNIAREVFPKTRFEEWAMFIGGDEAKRLNRMAQADEAAALQEQGLDMQAAEVTQQPITERADLQPSAAMFVGEYEVLVQIGSTEYRDPKLREERLREMFFAMLEAAPQLQQMGIQFDLGHMLRLWMEATDLTDIDSLLGGAAAGQDPAAGQQDMMAQMMAQMGQGAPPGAPPGGGGPPPPPPGVDPTMAQSPANTGMLESGEIAPAAY